ncbi:dTMP kinase [Candidatus Pacearchaeota archaeon]|nr:dTMP kinase [Candidatus Pacearchaeota archaeon]
MERKKSLLITFEGGEGSGKTTQIVLFHEWFSEKYGTAITSKEPGGTPVAEEIRKILLNPKYDIDPHTELFLFEAARSSLYRSKVTSLLREGRSVLCDRSIDSTLAYQGYAGSVSMELIKSLNLVANSSRIPDLTFIIDVDPEVGVRNAKRSKGKDISRIDTKDIIYHQKVAEGFRDIARVSPERCVLIPYEAGIQIVQDKIRNEFSRRYLLKF